MDPVTGEPGRDGEICLDLSPAAAGADDRVPGRSRAERRGDARRVLPHRRRGHVGCRRLHHLRGPHRRRVQGVGLPHLAVRAGERADRAPGGGRGGGGPSPDPLRLAVPKAYVVLAAGREPSPELARSILAFCRERLAPYKRIRRIEFADLPKTISGKIRRVELRGQETAPPRATRGVTVLGRRLSWLSHWSEFVIVRSSG